MGKKNSRKILKRIGKRCPECHSALIEVMYSYEDNGITYSEKVIECSADYCDYKEIRKNKHKDNGLSEEY